VQIGIFSVESNAENARGMMQRAGLNAEIRRGRAGENQFWRVVVGPAASTEERAGLLTRVRGLGFADAYAVAR
jgi:cell division protein FtsN